MHAFLMIACMKDHVMLLKIFLCFLSNLHDFNFFLLLYLCGYILCAILLVEYSSLFHFVVWDPTLMVIGTSPGRSTGVSVGRRAVWTSCSQRLCKPSCFKWNGIV